MSALEKCVLELGPRLKKKGVEDSESMAQNMCSMWASENGQEKEFSDSVAEETQRKFAMNFEFNTLI